MQKGLGYDVTQRRMNELKEGNVNGQRIREESWVRKWKRKKTNVLQGTWLKERQNIKKTDKVNKAAV